MLRNNGARRVIAINFGVGGNPRKKVGQLLEQELLLSLLQEPNTVIVLDKGFGEKELHYSNSLLEAVKQKGYSAVLLDWITEAALGLGADKAQVNASSEERSLITEALLAQACQQVNTRTGKTMQLTLADADPLDTQGILLTAADGRVAFNNQVKTRIMRNQRTIHQLIYEAVFAPKQEEQL